MFRKKRKECGEVSIIIAEHTHCKKCGRVTEPTAKKAELKHRYKEIMRALGESYPPTDEDFCDSHYEYDLDGRIEKKVREIKTDAYRLGMRKQPEYRYNASVSRYVCPLCDQPISDGKCDKCEIEFNADFIPPEWGGPLVKPKTRSQAKKGGKKR